MYCGQRHENELDRNTFFTLSHGTKMALWIAVSVFGQVGLSDGCTGIHCPQRMHPNDFGDPDFSFSANNLSNFSLIQ